MSRNNTSRIAPDKQGWAYNQSEPSERPMTQSDDKNDCRGKFEVQKVVAKCLVCGKSFYPTKKNQKMCSDECRAEYRRIKDQERYRKLVGGKEKATSHIQKAVEKQKLTHKGQLKNVFNSAKEALNSLNQSEIEDVERIMALPHAYRWEAGACNWTEAQRVLARKIELKRIAFDAKILEEEDNLRNRLYQSAQADNDITDEDEDMNDETKDNN